MAPLMPYPPPTAIDKYLPPSQHTGKLFLTLTYATSLDSHLSIPLTKVPLSGPETKSLTHHLRTFHDAILIGVGTVVVDDPGLNSRLPGTPLTRQPRPVILDPAFRWKVTRESRVVQTAERGEGLAPYVFVRSEVEVEGDERKRILEEVGGKVVVIETSGKKKWSWHVLSEKMKELDLHSVMVEGGGGVINDLLAEGNLPLVDSVIITIAPTYLGQGGVNVSPRAVTSVADGKRISAVKFTNVEWRILGRDAVMFAQPDL
ncbi:bacterial bifunctional deaminase-reductase [Choiromyces venosus 120613-1]|uniref:2,5-diamino-6-ribosylamino-4(3H)-pyrimidinone 5'-phosphate reductase n=1 Tax=Choiromyces venosus 120613-1 TaxID=1336337 RepID=A0A3N4K9K3_9PEZI|nr:bacterial bifunctional deaminase-reductase [Choiromyces venosus 120613-1]